MACKSKEHPDGLKASHEQEGFFKVKSFFLIITLSHKSSFYFSKLCHFHLFISINYLVPMTEWYSSLGTKLHFFPINLTLLVLSKSNIHLIELRKGFRFNSRDESKFEHALQKEERVRIHFLNLRWLDHLDDLWWF